jgi:hypothetical protein
LSDAGGVYAEAAEALRAEVERVPIPGASTGASRIGQFRLARPEPQWVVAVGSAAQRAMQELFATIRRRRPAGHPGAAPGIRAHRRRRRACVPAMHLRGILDQPPARQMDAGPTGDSPRCAAWECCWAASPGRHAGAGKGGP